MTAAADYMPKQIQAWAQPERDVLQIWHAAMAARNSIVARIGGEIAGFSDVTVDGYLNMMFVSPRHQRRGVAQQLLACVKAQSRSNGTHTLYVNVSNTARPFFERFSFRVEAELHTVLRGVELSNYKMRKVLRNP
ncbi:GNAT family N-acetyltransferase [Arthrobacter sp. lap29]|uniref:GNAT family N-acetyltransferase n=1 Tax=Arthrobacter sp. lap29 TaxID=3056122 RepID=UPI0028F6FC75|nr:GNAT family N-acetyltransferase [Arthrobacter sp. lap29]